MWRKLSKQISVEREMLTRLLTDHQPLIHKCATSPPDPIELSALAAMLHGLYNGIENVFKRIAIELNESLPEGQSWHSELLEMMSRPGPRRPAVISKDLAERLKEYLEFRHFFRSAYPFQLRWEYMAHLVQDCRDILQNLEFEVDALIEAVRDQP